MGPRVKPEEDEGGEVRGKSPTSAIGGKYPSLRHPMTMEAILNPPHASAAFRHGFPTRSARSSLTRPGMTSFFFAVSASRQRWRLAEASMKIRHSRPRERETSGACRESMPEQRGRLPAVQEEELPFATPEMAAMSSFCLAKPDKLTARDRLAKMLKSLSPTRGRWGVPRCPSTPTRRPFDRSTSSPLRAADLPPPSAGSG